MQQPAPSVCSKYSMVFVLLAFSQVPDIAYPRQWGRDVEPLYKHLRTEERYSKAVRQVGDARC